MRKSVLRALVVALLASLVIGGYYFYSRVLLGNFAVVVPGKVYRSAQPSITQLARWTREYHLKTILDLRGSETGAVVAEQAEADRLGVKMICIAVGARVSMPRPVLIELMWALESCEKPMLIHCYSGVDRSGAAGVLAAMALGGESFDSAKREASAPSSFFRRLACLDYVGDLFQVYESYCARKGVPPDGWGQFKKWAMDAYWPRYYHLDITGPGEITLAPGESTDVEIGIRNLSEETLPAGDAEKAMVLAAYTRGPMYESTASVFVDSSAPLPVKDVPSGGSCAVKKRITAPTAPGDYDIFFDVFEALSTSFTTQGSRAGQCTIHVAAQSRPAGNHASAARSVLDTPAALRRGE